MAEDGLPPTRSRDPVLAAIALLAVLGFAWGIRNYGREHDRHVVLGQVRELESRIRSHQQTQLQLLVEGDDASGRSDPPQAQRHQAILRDFDRLEHLGVFAMTDVEVSVDRDQARAIYRIRVVPASRRFGPSAPPAGAPVPSGGEMLFERQGTAWRLVGHRLIER